MNCDREEFVSLVSLLDDKDIVVSECVRKRLSSLGSSVVASLRQMRGEASLGVAPEIIDGVADSLNADFCLQEFSDLVAKCRDGLPLFEASCIVSSLFDREFVKSHYESQYLRASSEYVAEASDQRTAVENIRIFNHIFFRRLGFTVFDVEMKEPKYAVVSRVMRSREGNPFAIAFIYYMIAQVAGLPLRVLCFPGGFVPVYVENGQELFYINVYRNGEIFHKERLREFMSALGLQIDLSAFTVKDEKALMTLYLESLQFVFGGTSSNAAQASQAQLRALDSALNLLGPDRYLSVDEDQF